MKIINEERLEWAAAEIGRMCAEAEEGKRKTELAVLMGLAEGFTRLISGTTLTSKIWSSDASMVPLQISIHRRHALRPEAVRPYIRQVAKCFQEAANAEECVFAEGLYEILEALRDALGCFEIVWEETKDPAATFAQEIYIDFEEEE